MKNFKRAAAILGVVVLLAVCCLPMIFAFGSGDNAQGNFKAAVGTVILVPVLAYVFLMVYKLLKKENKEAEGEVKNIIFDVGQVLVSYDWESYLKEFHFPAEEEKLIAEKVFKSRSGMSVTVACFLKKNTGNSLSQNFRLSTRRM